MMVGMKIVWWLNDHLRYKSCVGLSLGDLYCDAKKERNKCKKRESGKELCG